MSVDTEVRLAEMVHDLIGRLESGDLDPDAAERGITPRQLVSAAIVEMCRQAFRGEWEGAPGGGFTGREVAETILSWIDDVEDPEELTQMERNIRDFCQRRVD